MKTLNNVKTQINELENRTSKGFASLMYKYTRVVTSESFDNLLNEALKLEEQGESVWCLCDEDYFSIAVEYCDTDNNYIKERFGRFGYAYLYMDELGRGLVVEYY